MSLPYAVSVAWLRGDAGLPSFVPEVRGDPAVAGLLDRVQVVQDDFVPSNIAARLTVTGADGRAETMRIDVPQGFWDRPLPDDALLDKFHALAGPVLGPQRCARLAETVMALGWDAGLEGFTDMLRATGPSNARIE